MEDIVPEDADEIHIWKEDDLYVIRSNRHGVTTQGETRIKALLMLADALAAGYTDENLTTDDLKDYADTIFTPDEDAFDELEELRNDE